MSAWHWFRLPAARHWFRPPAGDWLQICGCLHWCVELVADLDYNFGLFALTGYVGCIFGLHVCVFQIVLHIPYIINQSEWIWEWVKFALEKCPLKFVVNLMFWECVCFRSLCNHHEATITHSREAGISKIERPTVLKKPPG